MELLLLLVELLPLLFARTRVELALSDMSDKIRLNLTLQKRGHTWKALVKEEVAQTEEPAHALLRTLM